MSPRLKSILLIVLTLLIGGVLGALLQARMAEQRIERIAAYRSERGFIRFVERGIEPHDEQQQEQIRAILSSAASRVSEKSSRHRQEMRAIIDSTHAELADILTPEQETRLREHLETRPQRRGQGQRRGHRRGLLVE